MNAGSGHAHAGFRSEDGSTRILHISKVPEPTFLARHAIRTVTQFSDTSSHDNCPICPCVRRAILRGIFISAWRLKGGVESKNTTQIPLDERCDTCCVGFAVLAESIRTNAPHPHTATYYPAHGRITGALACTNSSAHKKYNYIVQPPSSSRIVEAVLGSRTITRFFHPKTRQHELSTQQ